MMIRTNVIFNGCNVKVTERQTANLFLLDRHHNWNLDIEMSLLSSAKPPPSHAAFPGGCCFIFGSGQVSSLSSCSSGQLCRTCLVVCSPSPQGQSGEKTSRNFQDILCWFRRLCPDLRRKIMSCWCLGSWW